MTPEDFFRIVPSPEAFQFGSLNLYRPFFVEFAHRLIFAAHPGRRFNPGLSGGRALGALPRFLKALAQLFWLSLSGNSRGRVLFYNPGGRLSRIDGQVFDLYTPNILAAARRDDWILLEDTRPAEPKTPAPHLVSADFLPLFALLLALVRVFKGAQIRAFVARILQTYPELPFTPAEGVKIVSRFFARYYLARFWLALLAPRRVVMICHYTREGFIAACKAHGLHITELMHGEITPGHSFYNLPPMYATPLGRALLPDRILTYGAYWKDILLRGNFLPEQNIAVVGYYLKVPQRNNERLADGRRLLLIATQFTIQETFRDYAAFLKERLDPREWLILIKPHPSEDAAMYRPLETPGFVEVTFENIYALLDRADILISSYSTVLYEGLRYRCAAFALYNQPYENRWQEFMDSGLFSALYPGELPKTGACPPRDARDIFADFAPQVLGS